MLAAIGYEVTVFVPDDSLADRKIFAEKDGIRVVRFNSDRSRTSSFLGYTARISYEFAQITREMIMDGDSPDIIEAQDYLGISYYILQFKQLKYEGLENIPVVLTLHSPAFLYLEYNRVPTYRFPDFWTCEMEKQAIKMADHLISPTRYLADTIGKSIPLGSAAVSVIRNPFRAKEIKPAPAIRNKIIYYGKLSPQKGSFELLRYFKDLWDKGFPHSLHIIGGTDIVYHPEGRTMGQIVDREYGKYIRAGLLKLHGKIAPSSIGSSLADAHVVIVPSIVDNLPYVVIEAMALGRIVLASIQGGQREMIDDGVDGFLFDHNEMGSFEKKLNQALSLSDLSVQAMGQAAIKKVIQFYNPVSIGDQKTSLLKEVARASCISRREFPFLHERSRAANPERVESKAKTLSVVIPYYNMGKYIGDCLRSIKASTYNAMEIIIVNDGSTEKESVSALERLAENEDIRIYHKHNGGVAEARNYGAWKASGEFLAFLDADDAVEPDYYQKAITVLQSYDNVFFAGSWVRYFGESQKKWATFTPQPPYLLVHNPINSSGLVYKKAAFLAAGINDKQVGYGLEDYESVISMTSSGYNGVVLPEFLFLYRVRSESMIRKITREKLLYAYMYITGKHARYYSEFSTDIINILNANGPGFLFDNPSEKVCVSSRPAGTGGTRARLISWVKRHKFMKQIALRIIKLKNL